jgi:hypothetical protein
MFSLKKYTNHNDNHKIDMNMVVDNNHNIIPKYVIIINLENKKSFYNFENLKNMYKDFTIITINNPNEAIHFFNKYKDTEAKILFRKINCFKIKSLFIKLFLLKHTGGISINPSLNITNRTFSFYSLLGDEHFLYNKIYETFDTEICSVFPNNKCINRSFEDLKEIIISYNYDNLNINKYNNIESTIITNNNLLNNLKQLQGHLINDILTIFLHKKNIGNIIKHYLVDRSLLQKINSFTLVSPHILQPNISIVQENIKEIQLHNQNITLFNGTPSICYNKCNYLFIKRWVSYKLNEQAAILIASERSISINTIHKLDENLKCIQGEIQIEKHSEMSDNYRNATHLLDGIEDIRLFNFQDKIYCSGSVIKNNKIGVFLSETEITDNDFIIKDKTMFTPNFHKKNGTEKNWTLVDLNNELKVIYMWYPITICDIDNEKHEISLNEYKYNIPVFFKGVRGSTPGILYRDEIWFVLHKTKMLNNGTGNYFHFLAVFDLNMNFKRHSELFKFNNYQVEFCAGLLIEDDRFIITYSYLDNQSCLITLNHDYVNNKLLWF